MFKASPSSEAGVTPSQQVLAAYWLWEVKLMDEAIEWLKRCSNPMPEESEIGIRPMFEAADLGEEFTPELQAKEANLEAALSMEKAPSSRTCFSVAAAKRRWSSIYSAWL